LCFSHPFTPNSHPIHTRRYEGVLGGERFCIANVLTPHNPMCCVSALPNAYPPSDSLPLLLRFGARNCGARNWLQARFGARDRVVCATIAPDSAFSVCATEVHSWRHHWNCAIAGRRRSSSRPTWTRRLACWRMHVTCRCSCHRSSSDTACSLSIQSPPPSCTSGGGGA
jgi:hypothetical protein